MMNSLRELLLHYGEAGDETKQKEVESTIWTQYGAERTVLIWDMSGFSMLTRRHGIVHYLSMVRRMQEVTRPIVHDHNGSIIKFEADNGFAVLPNPDSGVRTALAMNAAFLVENAKFPEEFDIRVSCGLDHGQIILIEGEDFFGDAVNVASKLGEDIASAGEILISKTVADGLEDKSGFSEEIVRFSISGLDLDAVKIVAIAAV